MSEFTEAINDLAFVQRRFKALMEAIPALQAIDSLEDRTKTLEETIKGHQDTILSLQAQKDAEQVALDELKKAQEKRKEEFGAWVAEEKKKAVQASQAIVEASHTEAAKILSEASETLKDVQEETKKKEETLDDLNTAIMQANDQFNAIQASLKKIKESI